MATNKKDYFVQVAFWGMKGKLSIIDLNNLAGSLKECNGEEATFQKRLWLYSFKYLDWSHSNQCWLSNIEWWGTFSTWILWLFLNWQFSHSFATILNGAWEAKPRGHVFPWLPRKLSFWRTQIEILTDFGVNLFVNAQRLCFMQFSSAKCPGLVQKDSEKLQIFQINFETAARGQVDRTAWQIIRSYAQVTHARRVAWHSTIKLLAVCTVHARRVVRCIKWCVAVSLHLYLWISTVHGYLHLSLWRIWKFENSISNWTLKWIRGQRHRLENLK